MQVGLPCTLGARRRVHHRALPQGHLISPFMVCPRRIEIRTNTWQACQGPKSRRPLGQMSAFIPA